MASGPETPDNSWGDESGGRTVSFGTPGSKSFRMIYVEKTGRIVSPWHDIPLYGKNSLLHAVCTTPAGSWAVHTFAAGEDYTPLQSVSAQNRSRSGQLHFAGNSPWNHGLLPRTWHDPDDGPDEYPDTLFADQPLEVLDVGRIPMKLGQVFCVKPLGAFPVLHRGRLSITVVGISGDDPLMGLLNHLEDIPSFMPGVLEMAKEWLAVRYCSEADPERAILLGEPFPGPDRALIAGAQANASWQLYLDRNVQAEPWLPEFDVFSGSAVLERIWSKYTSAGGGDEGGVIGLSAPQGHVFELKVPEKKADEGKGGGGKKGGSGRRFSNMFQRSKTLGAVSTTSASSLASLSGSHSFRVPRPPSSTPPVSRSPLTHRSTLQQQQQQQQQGLQQQHSQPLSYPSRSPRGSSMKPPMSPRNPLSPPSASFQHPAYQAPSPVHQQQQKQQHRQWHKHTASFDLSGFQVMSEDEGSQSGHRNAGSKQELEEAKARSLRRYGSENVHAMADEYARQAEQDDRIASFFSGASAAAAAASATGAPAASGILDSPSPPHESLPPLLLHPGPFHGTTSGSTSPVNEAQAPSHLAPPSTTSGQAYGTSPDSFSSRTHFSMLPPLPHPNQQHLASPAGILKKTSPVKAAREGAGDGYHSGDGHREGDGYQEGGEDVFGSPQVASGRGDIGRGGAFVGEEAPISYSQQDQSRASGRPVGGSGPLQLEFQPGEASLARSEHGRRGGASYCRGYDSGEERNGQVATKHEESWLPRDTDDSFAGTSISAAGRSQQDNEQYQQREEYKRYQRQQHSRSQLQQKQVDQDRRGGAEEAVVFHRSLSDRVTQSRFGAAAAAAAAGGGTAAAERRRYSPRGEGERGEGRGGEGETGAVRYSRTMSLERRRVKFNEEVEMLMFEEGAGGGGGNEEQGEAGEDERRKGDLESYSYSSEASDGEGSRNSGRLSVRGRLFGSLGKNKAPSSGLLREPLDGWNSEGQGGGGGSGTLGKPTGKAMTPVLKFSISLAQDNEGRVFDSPRGHPSHSGF